MHRPFEGVRIVDLTHFHAGPLCTYQLALLGADVIKVETPGNGDMMRRVARDRHLRSVGLGPMYMGQNANKRSISIDLKDERGKAVFRRLVDTADALIENMRPGTLPRLGLGFETLRVTNPKLVYCAISGFGQSGPLTNRPAFDHVLQGFSGMMSVTGTEEGGPMKVGFPVGDSGTALMAAFAVTSALYEVKRTGKGLFVDVSMLESSLVLQSLLISQYLLGGEVPKRIGNAALSIAPYVGTFDTKDGIILLNPSVFRHFEQLCASIGRPELLQDPRCADEAQTVRNRVWLRQEIQNTMMSRTAKEWEEALSNDGVPASRVRTLPEVLDEEHLRSRPHLTTLRDVPGAGRDVTLLNVGFKLDDDAPGPTSPPPRQGEHTVEVLRDLGLDSGELEDLLAAGVVAGPPTPTPIKAASA